MALKKNKCFAGKCINAVQGANCMHCKSESPHKDNMDKYIYPILREDCDCGDYKAKQDGN